MMVSKSRILNMFGLYMSINIRHFKSNLTFFTFYGIICRMIGFVKLCVISHLCIPDIVIESKSIITDIAK